MTDISTCDITNDSFDIVTYPLPDDTDYRYIYVDEPLLNDSFLTAIISKIDGQTVYLINGYISNNLPLFDCEYSIPITDVANLLVINKCVGI